MQKAIIWANGIWQGISDLYQGAVNLQNSLSYESYTAAMKQGGLDIGGLQAGNTQALANLSAQVEQLKNALAQIVAAYSQIVTGGTQLADGSTADRFKEPDGWNTQTVRRNHGIKERSHRIK